LNNQKFNLVRGDVQNSRDVNKAIKDADIVFHLAAFVNVPLLIENPMLAHNVNTRGTLNLLQAILKKNIARFIYVSTCAVYGEACYLPISEEHPTAPLSPYGISKLAAEQYCKVFNRTFGLKTVCLRYFNVYGPRLTHGVIYDFYHKLKRNPKKLEILGDGNQEKSYLHVSDAVDATLLAARKTGKYSVFNVGSEETITVREIGRIVASLMGLENVKYEFTGGRIGWPGDVPLMLLSIEKLKSLGWKPKFSIKESIIDTVSWLQTYFP